jgi:DNA-binding response OmpR family regulator
MNKTILVVDYERNSLDEIQQLFEDEQFTLLTAFDGSQALDLFEKKCPDLVLTSALLPKLNGFELCKKIASGNHGEIRPVIMFSGIYKAEKYRKEAIIGCGAVDFLEKPLNKGQLLKVVKGVFSKIPSGYGPLDSDRKMDNIPGKVAVTPSTAQGGRPLMVTSEDLLEVGPLLEGDDAARVEESLWLESSILGADLTESKRDLPSPIEAELEAAVDAVRLDLDARLHDQQIARAIELDSPKAGQNILEFDSESDHWRGSAREGSEIIELDVSGPELGTKPKLSSPGPRAGIPAKNAQEEKLHETGPDLALNFKAPKNWAPLIAVAVVGLLIILILCWR